MGFLGKVDTPRRKRGDKAVESVETPGEAIVKYLTTERIRELRKVLETEAAELRRIQDDCKLLEDENISDEKLKEIEANIEAEEREEAEKEAVHQKWLEEREEKKKQIQAALKAHSAKLPLKGAAAAAVQQAGAARRASIQSEQNSISDIDSPASASKDNAETGKKDVKEEAESSSPLLTSLLKSPAANAGNVDTDTPDVSVVKEEALDQDQDSKMEVDSQEALEQQEDQDDEVIIKKDDGTLKPPAGPRTKKVSDMSEDEEEEMVATRRETRSKKISERSDETEESPAPPPSSRSTRRSKKLEVSSALFVSSYFLCLSCEFSGGKGRAFG